MAQEHFDAIVIGSGQGGNPLARAMASHGWKTAMVERKWVGGTCVNTGCTPTKTMIASARVAYLSRRAADFGVHTGPVSVSLPEILARKRAIVETSRANNLKGLTSTENLTLILGEASFTGSHELTVTLNDAAPNGTASTRDLTAPRIFLDTGVRSTVPPIPGLRDVPFLDNASLMELDQLPAHLIILGGGYIAVEFAQMFRRFGSEVTIIDRSAHLAEHEDPDVSDEIASILRQDGVQILLETSATACSNTATGLCVSLAYADGTRDLNGSHLLVAVGRTPNTEALHLERAGITLDPHGFIQCNDRLETSTPGIYAIGDCKGGPQFTHIAYDDFRILRDNLLAQVTPARTTTGRPLPYTLFLDPELGRVGLTEEAARKFGKNIKVSKMPATSIARSLETGETRGFLKAVVDRDTDQILGVSMLSENGGELASMVQIAMMGHLPATALAEGIWSHPTWSESLNTLFTAYLDTPK